MLGIWKKTLLVVGVGTLILIGSSIGSAVVTQTGLVGVAVEALGFGEEPLQRAPRSIGGFPDAEERRWARDRAWELERLQQQICDLKRAADPYSGVC